MTLVVLPVIRIERSENIEMPSDALLKRIGWAIDDSIDDERYGIARLLEEARAEITRLSPVSQTERWQS